MKSVKNLVYAVLLAFVLGISASADGGGGTLDTPGFHASPSPTPYLVMATTDQDTVSNDCVPSAGSTETSSYQLYEALVALLSVY
jgi:hypothetical protein